MFDNLSPSCFWKNRKGSSRLNYLVEFVVYFRSYYGNFLCLKVFKNPVASADACVHMPFEPPH